MKTPARIFPSPPGRLGDRRARRLHAPARARGRPVLRPEQGPVPGLRLQGPEDRALRHLLLPGGGGGGRAGGAHGRALVRAPLAAAQPRASRGRQPLILYASHPDFEQTNVIAGRASARARAASRSRSSAAIVLPLGGPARRDRPRDRPRARPRLPVRHHGARGRDQPAHDPAAVRLPLWFIEGMAEYLSIGPVDPNTAMWMRDAVAAREAADHQAARRPAVLPVSLGPGPLGLRRRALGRRGDRATMLTAASRQATRSGSWRRCSALTPRSSRSTGTRRVQRRLPAGPREQARAGAPSAAWCSRRRTRASSTSRPPSAPTARQLVFLSERGLFSIDLFVADAATGQGAAQAHLDRRPTRTSTASSSSTPRARGTPTGRRFVFGGDAQGQAGPGDLRRGRRATEREIPFAGPGRDPRPDLVAGRPGDRLQRRMARRPHRSLRLRPESAASGG